MAIIQKGKKNIQDVMDALQEFWGAEAASFSDIPDGTYTAEITQAVLNNSKASGRPQCSWGFKIIDGPMEGRMFFKHAGLDSEKGMSYFKADLLKLELDLPDSASDLPGILESAIGKCCQVKAVTKDEYQNIRIISVVGNTEEFQESDEAQPIKQPMPKRFKADEGQLKQQSKGISKLKAKQQASTKEIESETEGIEIAFTDDDIDTMKEKKILKLAEQHEVDTDQYESYTTLLEAIATKAGVTGSYSDPGELIKAIS